MKALDKIMNLLGKPGKNKILSLEELVKVRASCARLIIDCGNLETENETLIIENAKMTKRRSKLECKLKDAIKESAEIMVVTAWYEDHVSKDVKNSKAFKKFKKLLKNKNISDTKNKP